MVVTPLLSPQSDQILNFRYLGQLAALVQLRRPLLQVDGGGGGEVVQAGLLQAVVRERLGYPWRRRIVMIFQYLEVWLTFSGALGAVGSLTHPD